MVYAFRDLAEPELPVIADLVEPGTIAIDVGAHYGDYTLALSRAVGNAGEVWAIEPSERFLDICRANVTHNHMTNVRCFEVGLSDAAGTAQLVSHEDPSRSYVGQGDAGGELIALVTLDELMARENSADLPVSFVKLDIEGSELAALNGAMRTITRWRPLMLIEFQQTASERSGHGLNELTAAIEALGYGFRAYSWDTRSWEPTSPGTSTPNCLCVPPG